MADRDSRGTVHYLCFGVESSAESTLESVPSAQTKIQYMIEAAKGEGFTVNVVSSCSVSGNGVFLGRRVRVDELETWKYFTSFRTRSPVFNKLSVAAGFLQLMWYCLTAPRHGDTVLIYHAIYYIRPIRWLRRVRKLDFILQVEEVYSLRDEEARRFQEQERVFISSAGGYVLVSDVIEEQVNIGDKPQVVAYGDYRVPPVIAKLTTPSGRIEVVYAGVVERSRRAAFTAVEAARHLSSEYRVNILGFGYPENVASLRTLIAEVNTALGDERVVYHGAKMGEEYQSFLQACHIGLDCHSYSSMDATAADSCFPNKITAYLANGLRVVSSRTRPVVESTLAGCLTFYSEDTAESVAAAILSVENFDSGSVRAVVRQHDSEFRSSLGSLLARVCLR